MLFNEKPFPKVWACGRVEYGRTGLGKGHTVDSEMPSPVDLGPYGKATHVSCGTAVSFAATTSGDCLSWGMGTNLQLGHEDEDEDAWEPKRMLGKQLETRKVVMVGGGGQHTVLIAKANE